MSDEIKRLYRSRNDRMCCGVCAGLAEYVNLDPTLVRALFALSAIFLFPMPIIVYLVLLFVIPEAPARGPAAPGDVFQS
jgi:phage shock protein C